MSDEGPRHRRPDESPLDDAGEAVTVELAPKAAPGKPPRSPARRAAFWVLIGVGTLVGLFIVLCVVLAIADPDGAVTAAESGATAPTTTTTEPPSSAPPPASSPPAAPPPSPAPPAAPAPAAPAAPAPERDPVDVNAPASVLARQGCEAYETGVSQVMEDAVLSKDLAPAIRVQMGLPPDVNDPRGVSVSAPYVVANGALGAAALDNPKYQSADDALNALSDAVIHASPDGDLSPIGQADAVVNERCSKILYG